MTSRQIVAATHNPAKVSLFAELVEGLAEVRAADHDISPEEEGEIESGDDLAEIARRKALAFARFEPECLVVATDGGLIVPALPAWRPARTRRFAGEGASNRERADVLLALAADLAGDQRRIWWREAMAVAQGGLVLASWVTESPPGLLATNYDPAQVAGDSGFWLPAIWRCPEYGGKRLIDLTPDELAARPDHWQTLGRDLRRLLDGNWASN